MIKGLTDSRVAPRRVGKIRAGYKDDAGGALKNPKHFLLHDAPQLIPVLGESPEEVYFTAIDHNFRTFAREDLRSYTRSELVCLGDGETAAYFSNGDAKNLRQRPHPMYNNSRERLCQHKMCPDYVSGNCTEHLFLDVAVPQYSMGALFTLDSSSLYAVINVIGTLQTVDKNYNGFIGGQIFRLYKQDVDMSYQNPKTGKKSKSARPVVHIEHVPFHQYEAKFRDQISDENWFALVNLREEAAFLAAKARMDRNRELATMINSLGAPQVNYQQAFAPVQETAPQATLPAPAVAEPTLLSTNPDEDALYARANDPVVVALFDELAVLRGRQNTEEARLNTAKMVGSVQDMVDWLKKTIAADKKKQPQQTSGLTTAKTAPIVAIKAAEAIADNAPKSAPNKESDEVASNLF